MKKINFCIWVPNSERGHKMPSLEGENEIPHIPKLDFFDDFSPAQWVLHEGISRQKGYNSVKWPPIKILRPLFTLQLLIVHKMNPLHTPKCLN